MLKKYLSLFSIFILYSFILAQAVTPPPPQATSGGIFTPGAPDPATTPIDEYTIYLVGFAILIAVSYFAVKKYKKSLI